MKTIDLTPAGCMTPEGRARVAKAQERVEDAHGQCALLLQELADQSDDDLCHFRDEIRATARAWKDATEEFLRAVCGR
jgi:hypothetical protein